MKPDIVFFGEELPKRFYFYLKDMLQTDLVLIMGTSLEVRAEHCRRRRMATMVMMVMVITAVMLLLLIMLIMKRQT